MDESIIQTKDVSTDPTAGDIRIDNTDEVVDESIIQTKDVSTDPTSSDIMIDKPDETVKELIIQTKDVSVDPTATESNSGKPDEVVKESTFQTKELLTDHTASGRSEKSKIVIPSMFKLQDQLSHTEGRINRSKADSSITKLSPITNKSNQCWSIAVFQMLMGMIEL